MSAKDADPEVIRAIVAEMRRVHGPPGALELATVRVVLRMADETLRMTNGRGAALDSARGREVVEAVRPQPGEADAVGAAARAMYAAVALGGQIGDQRIAAMRAFLETLAADGEASDPVRTN
jgi:hypothetical protein